MTVIVLITKRTLTAIQNNFHALIRKRGASIENIMELPLPDLKVFIESGKKEEYFPVPGMYGGFNYRFEGDGANSKLITESWCRVVEGSGQRHEITSSGTKLVAEEFV